MSESLRFIIRDGLPQDIPACLQLERSYETDYVWQMNIQEDNNQYRISFKTERLPRAMRVEYAASEERLHLALPPGQCFLVAAHKSSAQVLGYLTMRNDSIHQIGLVQDVVVSESFRRQGIGKRLMKIAQQWAYEHDLPRIIAETQTKNYPAILFCQAAGLDFCGFNDQYFQNQDIAVFFNKTLR